MNALGLPSKLTKLFLNKLQKIPVIAAAGGAKIHRHAVDQASASKGCFPPARPDDMQVLLGKLYKY
jgi:hypothetical protein